MVAVHHHDLEGARVVGFRTAFIPRPLEWGPEGQADTAQDGDFDIIARDFHDLAAKLGSELPVDELGVSSIRYFPNPFRRRMPPLAFSSL